jgi:hypothetical protein
MSIEDIGRRDFLSLTLTLLLAPARLLAADPAVRRNTYAVDIGILYSMLSFHLEGSYDEQVDRRAGRYEVRGAGQGSGIANRIESSGVLRNGRWTPVYGAHWFQLHGRESRTQVTYDHERRRIEYHARGETFFLRRIRAVDDTLTIPDGLHVDDAISATLNYRDRRWTPDAQGRLRTYVVRRRRGENEGPDDVVRTYRGEVVPLDLTVTADPESRQPAALVDFSRFTSWARQSRPARVVFDEERRPTLITGTMILGSTLSIRLG